MKPDKIRIFDTTLRDGEQSPGYSMNLQEKIRMTQQLENPGVDIIEAGFPIASEGDFQAVRAISETCETATVAALCRTTELDIARAAEALKKSKKAWINTFIDKVELKTLAKKIRRANEKCAAVAFKTRFVLSGDRAETVVVEVVVVTDVKRRSRIRVPAEQQLPVNI